MSVEMWINICQLLLQPHITVFLSFRVKQGWWKSMSFALHVSAICKAILAPAVWFIIGAPWNAFELCLLEPIQSWCNCVHIDAYRHRDLSTCSFGSWAHKDASALHSQQQDLQLTGCTEFRVYFHRIPYAMHHYALTLWIEHFSLWNPVFPLFCDLNPLQRSMIKFIDDPAYYKKSEYFLTNSHIYTDLSLDPLWSLHPLDPHRAQAFTTSSMASNCASKVAGNRKGRRSKPPDFLGEKPNVRVWICKNSWKGKHHGIQTSWDQGACCWLHEQGREVLKSAQPHDLLFAGMSIGAGNQWIWHIYILYIYTYASMYQTMMIWKNSGKANSWSCTSFGTWSSLWFVYLNLFQCCKCVTRVKRFSLDSLAEPWAIVIRRVVLRMVGWSQSSHPWTFIASIFCEAQLKDPPNKWIRNNTCLLGGRGPVKIT